MDLKPFIAAVSKEGLDIHGVLVRQHDTILDSFYWWDGRRDNIHSCSKTVLSLAMGMALEEGLLTGRGHLPRAGSGLSLQLSQPAAGGTSDDHDSRL